MTDWKQIQHRLSTEKYFDAWKSKCVDLRKCVLGDMSPVDEKAFNQVDQGIGMERDKAKNSLQYLYQVMTQDFEQGLSNFLLEDIRNLMITSAFTMPKIEADGLHEVEEALTSLYLSARLGPRPRGCAAIHPMRMATLCFLTDGLGVCWNTMEGAKPITAWIDTIDLSWDTSAVFLSDAQWMQWRVRRPLWRWLQHFKGSEKHFSDLLDQEADDRSCVLDRSVELMFHYDIIGQDGTECVARTDKMCEQDYEPLSLEDNPHFHMIDGYRQPFIPTSLIYFMQLPQAPMPIGVAEQILPHQVMHRIYERFEQAVYLRGMPFYATRPGAFETEEDRRAFEEGEAGALVETKHPLEAHGPMEIAMGMFRAKEEQRARIVGAGGVNPYRGGQTVPGTDFAREVNAIQVNAGTVEGAVKLEVTSHWAQTGLQTLWNGINYDIGPLILNMDGDRLPFGLHNPIAKYLDGAAALVVAEDATAYATREQRIARALDFWSVSTQPAALQLAPGSARIAWEGVVKAFGFRNTSKHFEGMVAPQGNPTADQSATAGAGAQ